MEIFETPPATGGTYKPLGKAEPADHDERGLRLKSDSTTVEVTALAPDLFRVGMFPEGRPTNYVTEAIAKSDWEPVGARMREEEGVFTVSTCAYTARVSPDPLRVSFTD